MSKNPDRDPQGIRHLTDEEISCYADAIISQRYSELPEMIRHHVENCLQCKEEVHAVTEAAILFGQRSNSNSNSTLNTPERILKRSRIPVFVLAAASVAIIAVSVLYYLLKYNSIKDAHDGMSLLNDSVHLRHDPSFIAVLPEREFISQQKVNSGIQNKKLSYTKKDSTDPYTRSDFFENLIASDYRDRAELLFMPENNRAYKEGATIRFRFDSLVPMPLLLRIYSNRGEKVFEKDSISGTSYSLNVKLTNGLYYWKAENSTDLLHIGEFIIK